MRRSARGTILGGEGPEGGLCSSKFVDPSGGGEREGSVQAGPSSAGLRPRSAGRFVPLRKPESPWVLFRSSGIRAF